MATLTVWKFETADGADEALDTLLRLESEQLLDLIDGAVVSWTEGAKKPRTRQLKPTMGKYSLVGAFWGLLFGLLFAVPLLGLALGGGMGALTASMADIGIDDEFITQVRQSVTPGTSALFLYTQKVQEGLLDKLSTARSRPTLIQSSLSADQEARLRAAFGEESVPVVEG
jgi:uncharacterized membrane protein